MQYEVECINKTEWFKFYRNCIQLKKCTYLAVTDDVKLYQQNNTAYDLQFTNSNNNT